MCCVRSAYCCSHSLSRNLQSTRLRDQKHCSFKKGLECSWKSWNIKAITCVLGRHTPWTPLVATSMAHQVQACFFLLSTLCIQKPHLISLVFLFLTVLLAFLGHLPPMTSYKFLAIILFFLLLTLSVQLHQLFGTPILTQSILPILNSFRHHLKTHLFKQLLMLPSSKLQSLRFTYVTNGTL